MGLRNGKSKFGIAKLKYFLETYYVIYMFFSWFLDFSRKQRTLKFIVYSNRKDDGKYEFLFGLVRIFYEKENPGPQK